MGFLEFGTPLSWSQSVAVRDYVKQHGLEQLLHLYRANRDRRDDELFWGDEVELFLCEISDDNAAVVLDADAVLDALEVREKLAGDAPQRLRSSWHPEFGNHMIEALPAPAYTLMNLESLQLVESSMRLRRAKIQAALKGSLYVNSLAVFPRFGLPGSFTPALPAPSPDTSKTGSIFIPDHLPSPHPRFLTLVKNIRDRRQALPFITIPVYTDKNTYSSGSDAPEANWENAKPASDLDRFSVMSLARKTVNPVRGRIYMDCFAFGMGQSCLQVTFGTPDLSSARHLYDQLAVLAPLFLPLTASSPFARGLLAGYDTRWSTLEQAVDCRTLEEEKWIPKSRYSNVSLYISDRASFLERSNALNDTSPPVNEAAMAYLKENGMDETLARHFGHLWLRDPMVIFAERISVDDTASSDHFENVQSTNWNSVRFKPPPPAQSEIGWRVEFRTPEVQLTDFENAACAAVVTVLARMIMESDDMDFYIPMSLVDENMRRGWVNDAITQQKFFFRREFGTGTARDFKAGWSEMSLAEIFTGEKGLLSLAMDFVQRRQAAGECSQQTVDLFRSYCRLFDLRANGVISTPAQFMRRFVLQHPGYQRDSVITPEICRDLSVLAVNVGMGLWLPQELFGELWSFIPRTPLSQATPVPSLSHAASRCSSFVAFVRPQLHRPKLPVEQLLQAHIKALQNGTASPDAEAEEEEVWPKNCVPAEWQVRCGRCGKKAAFAVFVRAPHPLRDFKQIYQLGPRRILCGAGCRQVYPTRRPSQLPAMSPPQQLLMTTTTPTSDKDHPSPGGSSTAATPVSKSLPAAAAESPKKDDLTLEAFPKNESLAMRWLCKYAHAKVDGTSECCSHGEKDLLTRLLDGGEFCSVSTASGLDGELEVIVDGYSRCLSLGYQVD